MLLHFKIFRPKLLNAFKHLNFLPKKIISDYRKFIFFSKKIKYNQINNSGLLDINSCERMNQTTNINKKNILVHVPARL